jgi:hypothetical protein
MTSDSFKNVVVIVSSIILAMSLIFTLFTCGFEDIVDAFIIIFGFGAMGLTSWGIFSYAALCELDPPLPYVWLIYTAFADLVEVILLPEIVYLVTGMQIQWFILIPWTFTLLTPYIAYLFTRKGLTTEAQIRITDAEILDIARKYGGILTQSVIVWEAKVALEEAKKLLERFCKHGEAYKKKVGSLVIYDFPSTRTYLSRTDNQIIEVLRDNPYGLSRAQLIQTTGLSIESLDEALKRLETKGIIYYDIENEIYKLMGIVPSTKNKGATE